MSSPVVQFVNGSADTLTMDLFFDTYTDRKRENVTAHTGRFARLLENDPDLHAPPTVKFIWGKFQFKAYIERLSQKFTMFLEDGTLLNAEMLKAGRARLDLTRPFVRETEFKRLEGEAQSASVGIWIR